MKLSTILVSVATAGIVNACPGQEGVMKDIHAAIATRQTTDPNDSTEMIGDLATAGATTTIGKAVQNILTGAVSPMSDDAMNFMTTMFCMMPGADVCCAWRPIIKDMEDAFRGSSGRCTGLARGAIRIGFHDAAGWAKSSDFGGADGSILLNPEEMTRIENSGLSEIAAAHQGWYNKYKNTGISMADLIQMGANVATVVCPLGPRVRSFVGRKDSTVASARLLPSPFQPADDILALFEDKTIKANGLAALLGAHTVSQQRFVNTSRATDPQDSTPGVWDVLFYGQTIGTVPTPARVFKIPSDVLLAAHPKMSAEWQSFTQADGQARWNVDYSREYVRLSLLGVKNINGLKECTKVLPAAVKTFNNPDQQTLNSWLTNLSLGTSIVSQVGNALRSGNLVSSFGNMFGF